MKQIYLDYAAATPLDENVLNSMMPYLTDQFGNPSSIHSYGKQAREAVESARESVAAVLHAKPHEIIFTAGGTESALLAIRGGALHDPTKRHIITSQIEHPAVLTACEMLGAEGFEITYLAVDHYGLVAPTSLAKALRDDTALVSIMYGNNEIGTVQDIVALSSIAREAGVPFHTDACQAAGSETVHVDELGVDLLTLNGSKIYGPKGVGVLYVRSGVGIVPMMPGGGQEGGMRGGTENVVGIVGMAKALKMADSMRENESNRLIALRDDFMCDLVGIEGVSITGHHTKRLANNIHITVAGIDGQTLVALLDEQGIQCSSSSACASASPEPSHVLLAIGLDYEQAFQGVRFSLGRTTIKTELDAVVSLLKKLVSH